MELWWQAEGGREVLWSCVDYPGPQGLEVLGGTMMVASRTPVLSSRQQQT